MEFYHRPVMLDEVLEGLNIHQNGVYFDGTAGGGGHSFGILSADETVRLIATDRDEDAIQAAGKRLAPFGERVTLVRSDYKNYETVLDGAGVELLDGVLLDFGISSHQIDDEARGFAYRAEEAPLDMRMDRTQSLTAEKVVNTYSEEALKSILREYGEEPFAHTIARNVVREREKQPIATCGQLRRIVENSIPVRMRGAACARQTFQAIRIEVNGELDGLRDCVKGLARRLKTGGRICILTFHSLEDRIVKQAFRDLSEGCTCPKNFPVCVCGKRRELRLVHKKPITAGEEERRQNSRSKCAKLRVAEKIDG